MQQSCVGHQRNQSVICQSIVDLISFGGTQDKGETLKGEEFELLGFERAHKEIEEA